MYTVKGTSNPILQHNNLGIFSFKSFYRIKLNKWYLLSGCLIKTRRKSQKNWICQLAAVKLGAQLSALLCLSFSVCKGWVKAASPEVALK